MEIIVNVIIFLGSDLCFVNNPFTLSITVFSYPARKVKPFQPVSTRLVPGQSGMNRKGKWYNQKWFPWVRWNSNRKTAPKFWGVLTQNARILPQTEF